MADVKLFEPQRLTDNPDGGGLATSNEVVDGQINNLFSDISRIDRVNGDVSLRKVFVQADTVNTDLFNGLHVIIQAPPLDPRVSAVLFETPNWGEVRSGAQSFIERYLDASVRTRFLPYDRQLAGQRTVLVFTRPEISLPEIGEVYCLSNESTGAVEYFRIADVDHEVQTFTDTQGDFKVRVITLTTNAPLSQEFPGVEPNRFMTAGSVLVRRTRLSDAARYHGAFRLAQDAEIGDLTIKLETIFAQLVPSATTEVAVIDAPVFASNGVLESALDLYTFTLGGALGTAVVRYVPTGLSPGSVRLYDAAISGNSEDDGGVLGSGAHHLTSGTVDYVAGSLTLTSTGGGGGYKVEYLPGVGVSAQAMTTESPVQIANRGYVYTKTLFPTPTPGSVTVQYRALGRWYELADDGSGRLVGDSGVGSGSVNYQSGTVAVTLGALPDIDSSVLFAWGTSSEYEIRVGDDDIELPGVQLVLEAGNCEPGTLSVTWGAGGLTPTATDDGEGNITGDATGRIIYGTGQVFLRPTTYTPNPTTTYEFTYQAGTTHEELFTPSKSGSTITITAADAPIRPGSIRLTYTVSKNWGYAIQALDRTLTDNGTGDLVDDTGTVVAGSAVDYETGDIVFNPDFVGAFPTVTRTPRPLIGPGPVVSPSLGYYAGVPQNGNLVSQVGQASTAMVFVNGTAVTLVYKEDGATDSAQDEEIPAPPLTLELAPRTTSAVVPGSVLFTFGGKTYYDRNGTVFHTLDPATGAGTHAGTIDYLSGVVTLTTWTGGSSGAFEVLSLLTQVAPLPMRLVHGRAPGSPLRPSSFQIFATRYRDSEPLSATADNNGNIDTPEMHGYVDVTTGVFSVGFGAWVLDSSLTGDDRAEPWYDADFVDDDGYIFRPDEVLPGSVRFNCVVQTSLPQDPEVIGINPVRLPTDGRVPAIRPGDTVVFIDQLVDTLPDDLDPAQVVALSRDALDSVALYDQNGLGIPTDFYTADLVAGELTMADPLDLSAYAEPLVALHVREDMALCTDAQITGEVSIGNPLAHAYSADNALCCSALIVGSGGGDVQARYTNLFEQQTWTNVWSDTRIGSAPSSGAQYDDVTYPLNVLNRDAISQRWALIFTSSTAFNIVSEERGVIGTGNTSTDVTPVNPATGESYFELNHLGFGTGWATGNVIRFETVAAGGPVWIARTVRSGPATVDEDRIRLQARWDKD